MEGNVSIQSKEGKIYKVSRKAAFLSEMMKEIPEDCVIPLNEDSKTIEKIIEYLEHFNGNNPQEIQKPLLSTEMKKITDEWSAQFIDKLTIEELVNLTAAAHYIQSECLLNLCCAKMVALCKGKSENEIFKVFGVDPEYFSTEKKDQIKATNGWVDDIFQ
jgi:alkylhydroperoxidase/carboxymuconolactone decarboxylase family protein YurZ